MDRIHINCYDDIKKEGDGMIISNDKKTITLDIPLGSKVYTFRTKCCDACLFEAEKFKNDFPFKETCQKELPCHTRFIGTESITFSLDTIGIIFPKWGIDYFSTKEEAEEKGRAVVEEHCEWMRKHGFNVNNEKGDEVDG